MSRLTNETLENAIKTYKTVIESCNGVGDEDYCPILDKVTVELLEELKKYRHLKEQGLLLREEDVLKFYYCESENKYLVGKRVGTMYYAEVGKTGLCFIMSRYLPWGEHVVAPHTVWKEHTYPSEPKEIPFFDWLQGYIKQLNSKAEAEKALAEMEK